MKDHSTISDIKNGADQYISFPAFTCKHNDRHQEPTRMTAEVEIGLGRNFAAGKGIFFGVRIVDESGQFRDQIEVGRRCFCNKRELRELNKNLVPHKTSKTVEETRMLG